MKFKVIVLGKVSDIPIDIGIENDLKTAINKVENMGGETSKVRTETIKGGTALYFPHKDGTEEFFSISWEN